MQRKVYEKLFRLDFQMTEIRQNGVSEVIKKFIL